MRAENVEKLKQAKKLIDEVNTVQFDNVKTQLSLASNAIAIVLPIEKPVEKTETTVDPKANEPEVKPTTQKVEAK